MEKFTTHTGPALPLRRSNVDTDQIIPAVYLKRVTRTGFEDGLFAAWRNDPDFVLNQPGVRTAPRSWSPVRTSAPARRASTPSGRCRTTASRSSSRAASATSSAATPARSGCVAAQVDQEVVEQLWTADRGRPDHRDHGRPRGAASVRAGDADRRRSRSTTTPAGGCSRGSTTSASRCRTRTTSPPTRRPGRRWKPATL